MNKNSRLAALSSKTNLAILCILLMLAGFLRSRALLSIGMLGFGAAGVAGISPRAWLRQRWWLLGCGWVLLYGLSWFWSTDKQTWWNVVQQKLPFLLLPLAFALLPAFSVRQLRLITLLICAALFTGMAYSCCFYLSDPTYFSREANHSKLLPTLVYGDHIRFSMAVALGIAWCMSAWCFFHSAGSKALLILTVVICVAYLHLLAAKTGLAMLYLMFFVLFVFLILQRRYRLQAIGLLAGIALLVLLAYAALPTFRGRIDYTLYAYQEYKAGTRNDAYSDIGRIVSYDVGKRLIREVPLLGEGAGDAMAAMKRGYAGWYPAIPDGNRLIPHNQFITTALIAGIPALLLLLGWLAAAFKVLRRRPLSAVFPYAATWLMLIVSLFSDAMLEVQFGVFVFLFFGLLQRHLLLHPPAEEPLLR